MYPEESKIIKRNPSFPTIEKVESFINEFIFNKHKLIEISSKGNLNEYHRLVEKHFLEKLGLLLHLIQPSNSNVFKSKIYRIREHDNSINLKLISEFSYLPAPLCSDFKRANYPFNPVFYGSPDPKTSLIETICYDFENEEGKLVFLSEWGFRENQNLNISPFFNGDYPTGSYLFEISRVYKTNILNLFPGLNEDDKDAILKVFNFFSNLFVSEEAYSITSFLSHSHFYELNNRLRTDILIYPSIRSDLHTVNYAIHPNTVEQKMELHKVFAIRIKKYKKINNKVFITFGLEKIGQNLDGFISWKAPDESIVNEFNNLLQSN